MTRRYLAVVFAALSAVSAALAQGSPEFFQLNFTLKETEGGKVVNSRGYQMIVKADENGNSSIRSGGRVPTPTSAGNNNYTYIDVGVNIDVKRLTHVTKDDLALDVVAEVSGAVEPTDPQARPSMPPIIRQARWNSMVMVPIRKPPVVIFSSDDATSKRQLQLELTVKPLV